LVGHTVTSTGRGDEALRLVRRQRFDMVIVDLFLSGVSGMEILTAALEANTSTIVVVTTSNASVASSLDALRAGAWEYLPKPFSASHLQILVGRAAHVVSANDRGRQKAPEMPAPSAAVTKNGAGELMTLLGNSPGFRKSIELAMKVATTDASVMISGESGTGKEMIAQLIHSHSRRANRKLVPVNCAALPEHLLESEMFGVRKGAFTGADRDKAGLLEVASGSTLFLDELTEMPTPLQAKLLRVLQDGVVRRLGSEVQDAVVDVRFISATNRDPQDAVRQGILREDLFYRLRVVPIKLPPLRQRSEDIPLLAAHFLQKSWERHRRDLEEPPVFTPEALTFLKSRSWPGNIRELQNLIEHVAVIADVGQEIVPSDIPVYGEAAVDAPVESGWPSTLMNQAFHTAKDHLISQFEREYLSRLTDRTGSNMSKAARLAGIDRTTLYRLMEKHGLRREMSDVVGPE
jgi:DNA-binding NtrC family response regulator